MVSIRDPPQNKRFIQTESEEMEKYSMQMEMKRSWGSNNSIRKNRLQNKDHNKRQRRSLYNHKGINPTRGYNSCKHICTQHKNTQKYKENLGKTLRKR